MNKPTAQARPGGGFNQQLGQFSDEHLDENALAQAAAQKQLAQSATNQQQAVTQGQGGQKAAQDLSANALQDQLAGKDAPPGQSAQGKGVLPTFKSMGSIGEELIKRPAKGILEGIMAHFSIASALAIDPAQDDPEKQAKKQKLHSRYQQLSQEDQAWVEKKYEAEMKKKKQEQEEEERRKQAEEQKKNESIAPPSSPKKGPVGPAGTGKQRAVAKLEQDRKTLGGPSSAN